MTTDRRSPLSTIIASAALLLLAAMPIAGQVPPGSFIQIQEVFIDGVPLDLQFPTDVQQCSTHTFTADIINEVPPVSYFWEMLDTSQKIVIDSSSASTFVFDVDALDVDTFLDLALFVDDAAKESDFAFRPLNVVPAPPLAFDGRLCTTLDQAGPSGGPCADVDGQQVTLIANSSGADQWEWSYREVGNQLFTEIAPFGAGQPVEIVVLPPGDYEFRAGIQNCLGAPIFASTFATIEPIEEPEPIVASLSGPSSVVEGDGQGTVATYTVTLSEPTGPELDLTVFYAATSATATAGQDFEQTFGSLSFGGTVLQLDFEVPITGDNQIEDDESFTVRITDVVPSVSEAFVTFDEEPVSTTIVDDDDFVVSFETGAAISIEEGDAGTTTPAEVTVSVSPAPTGSQSPTILFETVAGTATAGEDFVATSGSIVFDAGTSTRRVVLRRAGLADNGVAPGSDETIVVEIIGDDETEGDETFQVALSSGADGTTVSGDAATFVIADDDLPTEPIDVMPTETVSTEDEPEGPSVVLSQDGRSVVAWERNSANGQQVVLQFFAPDGSELSEIVPVSGSGFASSPSVVFTSSGNALIVWLQREGSAFTAGDGSVTLAGTSGSSILGRTFNQSGDPQSETTEIATGGPDDELEPEVEIDADGDVIVTWESEGAVNIQTLDETAQPTGEPTTIPASEGTMASSPSVARNDLGASVTVWLAEGGAQPGILALRGDQNGLPVGDVIVVTGDTTARSPHVAIDPFGGFFVTWEQDGEAGTDVMYRAYDSDGNPLDEPRAVGSTGGEESEAHVSSNSSGDYLVVWTSSGGTSGGGSAGSSILGRTFSNEGDETSDETVIAVSDQVGDPQNGEGAIDEDDSGVVVFERRGPDGSPEGVFKTEIESNPQPRECIEDANTVCLGGGRLEVIAEYQTSEATQQRGEAIRITAESTAFWFFEPDNLEVVVKVVDGCVVNSRAWVFATGLTDVDVNVIVTDTQTGDSKSYVSRSGAFQPIFDTDAFDICE